MRNSVPTNFPVRGIFSLIPSPTKIPVISDQPSGRTVARLPPVSIVVSTRKVVRLVSLPRCRRHGVVAGGGGARSGEA